MISPLVSDGISVEHLPTSYDDALIQRQREAVAALIDHDNGDIFAFLKLIRSSRTIEPMPEQPAGSAHVSPSQIHALFALKDRPNDEILSCIELARLCRNDATSMTFQWGASTDSGASNNLSSLPEQSDASSLETKWLKDFTEREPSRPGPRPPSRQYDTNNLSQHSSDWSVTLTRSKNAENHYWCTTCEELKSYKDSGNWKKHEKEHETNFVCQRDGAAESSTAGQAHASKPFTCKRRDVMVNHLIKSHGITEARQGRDLADEWRHTVKKQAWSCGFCISLFLTFHDRLKHIDIEHFRRRQDIRDWDLNKVVLGLLKQPKMEKAWKTRLALLPPGVLPQDLAWDKIFAKDLREKLEIGPLNDHHATTLADAAFSARRSNEGSWVQSGVAHANPHSDATAQATFSLLPVCYEAGSTYQPSSRITNSTAHLVSSDPLFVGAATSTFALGNAIEPAIPSYDDDNCVRHDTTFFNPSQSWTSGSETGTFFSGYEQSNGYAGGEADISTPNWYG